MKIELIAVGRLRTGPLYELIQDYRKRLVWPFSLTEIESKYKDEAQGLRDEIRLIESALSPQAFVIALDERGRSLSSRELSAKFEALTLQGHSHIQFIIGGANGLGEDLRARANLLLSFGQQTWPHMLARVMLLEQIYRCQQIQKGHPYHRD